MKRNDSHLFSASGLWERGNFRRVCYVPHFTVNMWCTGRVLELTLVSVMTLLIIHHLLYHRNRIHNIEICYCEHTVRVASTNCYCIGVLYNDNTRKDGSWPQTGSRVVAQARRLPQVVSVLRPVFFRGHGRLNFYSDRVDSGFYF